MSAQKKKKERRKEKREGKKLQRDTSASSGLSIVYRRKCLGMPRIIKRKSEMGGGKQCNV